MGWDIAGEVGEKSENTAGFEVGDAVFALLQNARGYAEFVAVNVGLLAHKPDNITFEEAANNWEECSTAYTQLISKAKELLSTTDLSVSEIAYALGFEHLQSFSKLFKTKTQLSPLQFRKSFN